MQIIIIEDQPARDDDWTIVKFDETVIFMPAKLASAIKTRVEVTEKFCHGLRCNDRVVALFRDAHDRDMAREFFKDIYFDEEWEAVP